MLMHRQQFFLSAGLACACSLITSVNSSFKEIHGERRRRSSDLFCVDAGVLPPLLAAAGAGAAAPITRQFQANASFSDLTARCVLPILFLRRSGRVTLP